MRLEQNCNGVPLGLEKVFRLIADEFGVA